MFLWTLGLNFMKFLHIPETNSFDTNLHNAANYIPNKSIYIGYKVNDFLIGKQANMLMVFFEAKNGQIHCSLRYFYIEATKQILDYLPFNSCYTLVMIIVMFFC